MFGSFGLFVLNGTAEGLGRMKAGQAREAAAGGLWAGLGQRAACGPRAPEIGRVCGWRGEREILWGFKNSHSL